MAGTLAAGILLGVVEAIGGYLIDSGPDARDQFRAVHARSAVAADGIVRPWLTSSAARAPVVVAASGCDCWRAAAALRVDLRDLAVHRAVRERCARHRLVVFLRRHAVHLARDRGVLRRRHVCGRDPARVHSGCARSGRRGRGRLPGGAGCRPCPPCGCAASTSSSSRSGSPSSRNRSWSGGRSTSNKTMSRYIFVNVSNIVIFEILLALSADRDPRKLVCQPHAARAMRCARSVRTRPSRAIPASIRPG